MNIYLDDDSVETRLVQLLTQAGHDVLRPRDVGLSGEDDPVHLTHAIRLDRVFVTHNHRDFEKLHILVQTSRGHHPGILAVRRDNNPKRDLDARGIVRALTRLMAAGVLLADELHVLNHWR